MSNSKIKHLTPSITGKFITDTAREWLYDCHKPYAEVEQLLLHAMKGTALSIEELEQMAQDLLLYRAELIGDSADGSLAYASSPDGFKTFVDRLEVLVKETADLKKELDTVTGKYLDLKDGIESHDLSEIRDEEDKRLVARSLPSLFSDRNSKSRFEPSSVNDYADAYVKAHRFVDNYGWLLPDGTYIPVDWGEHTSSANTFIEKHNWTEEYSKWYYTTVQDRRIDISIGSDFLIAEKGWVLLHSPEQGIALPAISDKKAMTKAQREFLFTYYAIRGEDALAKKFYEEE